MNKKLIAIDLDGTILDPEGHYSAYTREYLRALSAQGHYVVLSSGRPFRSMKHIYEDLHCTAPLIAYNGALSFNPIDRSFPIRKRKFAKEAVIEAYERSKDYVMSFMAESSRTVYLSAEDLHLARYFPYEGMQKAIGPFSEILVEDVYTCLFHLPIEGMNRLGEDMKRLDGVLWRSWHYSPYSELYLPDADKGAALRYIASILNVAKEDVFAFGDAENDIPMLQVAGHPFAMKGNKVPHLLGDFPETENPVEEDGVVRILQNWIKV